MAKTITKTRSALRDAKSKTKALGVKIILPVNLGFYGPEPVYDRFLTQPEVEDALTWYNYNMDDKMAITFAVQYLNEQKLDEDAKMVKAGGEKYFPPTLGRLAKIVLNGGKLPDYALRNFNAALDDGRRKYLDAKTTPVKTDFKDPPRLNESNATFMGTIMDAIDGLDPKFNIAPIIKALPEAKLPLIAKFLEAEKLAVSKWSTVTPFPDENINAPATVAYIDDLIGEIYAVMGVDRAKKPATVRKPRKKKAISPERQVAKVKIALVFPDLNLKSIDPKDIVGAKAVWLYDTRYTKLTVLRAKETLMVKGTSVIGYDEESSESKRIGRKAAAITKNVVGAGKVALRHIFADIKTASIKFTGRLSENTILLRVEK